jgi:hypothetical protein
MANKSRKRNSSLPKLKKTKLMKTTRRMNRIIIEFPIWITTSRLT